MPLAFSHSLKGQLPGVSGGPGTEVALTEGFVRDACTVRNAAKGRALGGGSIRTGSLEEVTPEAEPGSEREGAQRGHSGVVRT